MTVAILASRWAGANQLEVEWTSDQADPVYRLYVDGELLAETELTVWRFAISPGTSPLIEIRDDATRPPVYPGRATLHWRVAAGAVAYRVEAWSGTAWTVAGRVSVGGESAYATWTSDWLADGQTHQFRLLPLDAAGNEGEAVELAALIVRHPDPPEVALSYDPGTGLVTIA